MAEHLRGYPEQFPNHASLLPHDLYSNGLVEVRHNGIPAEPISSFLNTPDLSHYFDTNGNLIYRSKLDLFNLPSDRILPEMGRELGRFMNIAQESLLKGHPVKLDNGHKGLFNAHRWAHVKQVAEDASLLLQETGASQEAQDNAKIAGALHDKGNAAMREDHEKLGGLMAVDMYPSLTNNAERGLQIVGSINHHNEGFYRKIVNYAGKPFRERQNILQNMFTDSSAAIIVADKLAISRSRIEKIARNREVMRGHIHTATNMAAESRGLHYLPNDKTLIWNLQFNRYISEGERGKFGNLIVGQEDGRNIAYTHPLLSVDGNPENGADYYKTLIENLRLYGPNRNHGVSRFGLMADAALTMPGIEQFVMRYEDPDGNYEPVEFAFNSDTTDNVLELMAELAESV